MSSKNLARQLANARTERAQIENSALEEVKTESAAYEVQMLAAQYYDSPQTGYKVGATNETSQSMLGCDGPFFGPVFEADTHQAGATIDFKNDLLGGEAEFAFLIGRDLPADATLTQPQIIDYIEASHVAVEIIGRRTLGEGLPTWLQIIADFGGNSAFIIGPSIEDWQSINFADVVVKAHTDETETNTGSGAAVLGNPLNSLLWLHEALRERGNTLKAGQWVSTGTCLGVIQPKAGSQVNVSFKGCGEINYQLS